MLLPHLNALAITPQLNLDVVRCGDYKEIPSAVIKNFIVSTIENGLEKINSYTPKRLARALEERSNKTLTIECNYVLPPDKFQSTFDDEKLLIKLGNTDFWSLYQIARFNRNELDVSTMLSLQNDVIHEVLHFLKFDNNTKKVHNELYQSMKDRVYACAELAYTTNHYSDSEPNETAKWLYKLKHPIALETCKD